MFKKNISYLLAFVLVIIIVQVLFMYFYNDKKNSSYDYSGTKAKMLKGVIKRVIVSRYTRIEIDNEKNIFMIASDFPYPPKNPNTDTLFAVGDSILKKMNNDTFKIIRREKVFYYILPK